VLKWVRLGDACDREYLSNGVRGSYRIDLDQPPVGRWAIYVNGVRCVENVYYVGKHDNAQAMAAYYDEMGKFVILAGAEDRPDGELPRILLPRGPGGRRE